MVVFLNLVANMLSVAGADHIITMDLHASQIQVLCLDRAFINDLKERRLLILDFDVGLL